MNQSNAVTCSFTMDRDIFNAYKSVIHYETPNADMLAAIEEVQKLKVDPNKKSYGSFAELLGDLDNE